MLVDVAPVDETTDPTAAARAIVKEPYNFDPALADKPSLVGTALRWT